jgi:hypothetical protein
MLAAPSACTSERVGHAAERTWPSVSSHSQQPIAAVRERFAGLSLFRPASWSRLTLVGSDDLYRGASGYLTDASIRPGCISTSRPGVVTCAQPVSKLRAGEVYVSVEVFYQDYVIGLRDDGKLADHAADIDTAADPLTSGCPGGTSRAVTVEAWSDTVQPSQIDISGCFGSNPEDSISEFMTMLTSAAIASRPAATAPVPGAPPCTSETLRVSVGPSLSAANQEQGLVYAVENSGSRTCRTSGYPTVQLKAGGQPLPFSYVHGGAFIADHDRTIYLRPGTYATFQIYTRTCESSPRTTHASRVIVRLAGKPPTNLPATDRRNIAPIAYCTTPAPGDNIVHVGPLVGY